MQEVQYIKAKALVVGIDQYDVAKKLDNAVNDAKSIADTFRNLKFYVTDLYDITIDEWDKAFEEFIANLDEFQVCTFFFAGHGVEIQGENYLLCANTPADNETGTKRYSINLQNVIDRIKTMKCQFNIIMLDACRDNPFPAARAPFVGANIAPVFAPEGTLIAYSTSPGEKASDGGANGHSIYTHAILQHINELGLPIESFFKKVRTTVYNLSGHKQTSWEHTSLIGDFSFNSGQLIQNLNVGEYSDMVIRREDYDYSDADLVEIITGFLSTQFSDQRQALSKMKALNYGKLDKNQKFILGRCCMFASYYGCFDCQNFFKNVQSLVEFTDVNNHNDFLNGALFELYFDAKGTFEGTPAVSELELLIKHCKNAKLKSSFDYIHQVLKPFFNVLYFMPSSSPESVSFDVTLEKGATKRWGQDKECLVITSLRHGVDDIMLKLEDRYYNKFDNKEELTLRISEVCRVPIDYVQINSNISIDKLVVLEHIL